MKNYFLLLLLLLGGVVSSQNAADYQYIVVPAKYDFQKSENQYNLNAMTKMIFEKQGYQVYLENEILPQELLENKCKGLYAYLIENNTLFMTKLKLELRDCRNQKVFISEEGTSREKEYRKAYLEAFRVAAKSVVSLKSNPKTTEGALITQSDILPTPTPVQVASPALFAQPIANGYQLVDNTPKIVMKIFRTSQNNFFIAIKEHASGVLFNRDGVWFFEYYQKDVLMSEKLEIKF